jgi:O-methyltransferase
MSLYIDLMKRILINSIYQDPPMDPWSGPSYNDIVRRVGKDWPSQAHTMVGLERLNNIERLMDYTLHNVPGDYIETGVWRGGCCIFMQAILKEWDLGFEDAWELPRIFCCDSFQGLPAPDIDKYPQDAGDEHHTYTTLVVSVAEVVANFRKYNLYDDNVWLVQGFFKDTLPAMIEQFKPRFALIRLDGDMYQSTTEALENLYPLLNNGGYVIVDDYNALPQCKQAVDDYIKKNGLSVSIQMIDYSGVFFQKVVGADAGGEQTERQSDPSVAAG